MIEDVMRPLNPPLSIGDARIDRYSYYEEGDVLYLTAGEPRVAADIDESLEGDSIFLDASGRIIGVTIIGAREQLARDDALSVTLRKGATSISFPRVQIEPLLVETIRYE